MRTQAERRGPCIGDRTLAEILVDVPTPDRQSALDARVARARAELDDARAEALCGKLGDAATLQRFVDGLIERERRFLARLVKTGK